MLISHFDAKKTNGRDFNIRLTSVGNGIVPNKKYNFNLWYYEGKREWEEFCLFRSESMPDASNVKSAKNNFLKKVKEEHQDQDLLEQDEETNGNAGSKKDSKKKEKKASSAQ